MKTWLGIFALADAICIALGTWGGGGAAGWTILTHAVLTIASLYAIGQRVQFGASPNAHVCVLGAAFGPLGLFAFFLAKPRGWMTSNASDAHAATSSVQAVRETSPTDLLARVLDGRISIPQPEQVESLATTLQFGVMPERQRALETVVRTFEPQLSPLIALALTDSDQTIRALAAAAAAHIAQDVASRSADLETMIVDGAKVEDQKALAFVLARHSNDNVLLPQTQRTYLRELASGCLKAARLNLMHPQSSVRRLEATP